ncbi:hypothetical protein EVJ58_g6010 [Rhodofomes roseus]|uniref:GST N-terminal domain-containing protein n=1 Tax=Rhodofomes roseus TaxID=34475 RepID=A0A4Y9Y9S2_9APHY|nr:hypothetical protein EVJ58_g6010 [Rhodofomes roseus]
MVTSCLENKCFAPRFVLNFKRLPYVTEWVAYPDITEVLTEVGAPPTRTTEPLYTLPAIVDAMTDSPVIISDSTAIADYLEDTYPEPSIYPHGRETQLSYVAKIGQLVAIPMAFIVVPNTMKILPQGRDVEYYVGSRKGIFGIDLDDMYNSKNEAERWQQLEGGLEELSTIVETIEHGDRWLFGTAEGPGYADFVLAAAFVWFRNAGPEDGWERLRTMNGGRWERFFKSALEYMQVL